MDRFREPLRRSLAAAAAGVTAVLLCAGPAFIANAHAQTATNPPLQSAANTDPSVSANPAGPVEIAAQADAPAQPAVSAEIQPAGAAPAAAAPSQPVDQSPRQGSPPAPRGPVSVQGPARGGPGPARPAAVQGPARGPAGAYAPRTGGRRGGAYRGRGRPQAARPAQAPRLPNAGTGGLLDMTSTPSPITAWTPAALLLIATALGGAGLVTSRRRG
jgi:hypothetical protein